MEPPKKRGHPVKKQKKVKTVVEMREYEVWILLVENDYIIYKAIINMFII